MLDGACEPASCLLDKSKRHDFPKPSADGVVVDAVLAKVGVSDRQPAVFSSGVSGVFDLDARQDAMPGQAQHAHGGRAQHLDRALAQIGR